MGLQPVSKPFLAFDLSQSWVCLLPLGCSNEMKWLDLHIMEFQSAWCSSRAGRVGKTKLALALGGQCFGH